MIHHNNNAADQIWDRESSVYGWRVHSIFTAKSKETWSIIDLLIVIARADRFSTSKHWHQWAKNNQITDEICTYICFQQRDGLIIIEDRL